MEVGITIVYWTLIYKGPCEDPVFQVFRVLLHTAPLLLNSLDFLLQEWIFKKYHAAFVVLISMMYGMMNLVYTKISGKPIYDIMTWKDYKSLVIALCLVALFYL